MNHILSAKAGGQSSTLLLANNRQQCSFWLVVLAETMLLLMLPTTVEATDNSTARHEAAQSAASAAGGGSFSQQQDLSLLYQTFPFFSDVFNPVVFDMCYEAFESTCLPALRQHEQAILSNWSSSQESCLAVYCNCLPYGLVVTTTSGNICSSAQPTKQQNCRLVGQRCMPLRWQCNSAFVQQVLQPNCGRFLDCAASTAVAAKNIEACVVKTMTSFPGCDMINACRFIPSSSVEAAPGTIYFPVVVSGAPAAMMTTTIVMFSIFTVCLCCKLFFHAQFGDTLRSFRRTSSSGAVLIPITVESPEHDEREAPLLALHDQDADSEPHPADAAVVVATATAAASLPLSPRQRHHVRQILLFGSLEHGYLTGQLKLDWERGEPSYPVFRCGSCRCKIPTSSLSSILMLLPCRCLLCPMCSSSSVLPMKMAFVTQRVRGRGRVAIDAQASPECFCCHRSTVRAALRFSDVFAVESGDATRNDELDNNNKIITEPLHLDILLSWRDTNENDISVTSLPLFSLGRNPCEHQTKNETHHRSLASTAATEEDALCPLCYDQPACVVFMPCGHMASCSACAKQLVAKTNASCHMCRSVICYMIVLDGKTIDAIRMIRPKL